MKSLVAVSVLVLAFTVYETNSLCNTCSGKTGLACISETKMTMCVDGSVNKTADVIECPPGLFCTASEKVCDTVQSSCGKCNQCVEGNEYACRNYTAFSLCNGTTIDSTVYNCPAGLVCSISLSPICSDPDVSGIGATCPSPISLPSTTVPPTVDPETNPNAFCVAKGKPGRYEILADLTCSRFISCVTSGLTLTGNVYQCPKGNYFSETSQRCGPVAPTHCSGTPA